MKNMSSVQRDWLQIGALGRSPLKTMVSLFFTGSTFLYHDCLGEVLHLAFVMMYSLYLGEYFPLCLQGCGLFGFHIGAYDLKACLRLYRQKHKLYSRPTI